MKRSASRSERLPPGRRGLVEAMRSRRLIRFMRRFEKATVRGYVLDVGPKFFLLAPVSDRIRFEGFECYRVADVRGLRPDTNPAFVESALRKRGERLPRKPRVSLRRTDELLVSASRAFPLVTIHREEVDPDACWIGRVVGVRRGRMSLLEINPDASWDPQPTVYRLGEITQVDFGGGYEDALHIVGGDPPA